MDSFPSLLSSLIPPPFCGEDSLVHFSLTGFFSSKGTLRPDFPLLEALSSFKTEESYYEAEVEGMAEEEKGIYLRYLKEEAWASLGEIDGYTSQEVLSLFPKAQEFLFGEPTVSDIACYPDFIAFLSKIGGALVQTRDHSLHNYSLDHGFSGGSSLNRSDEVKRALSDDLSSLSYQAERIPSLYPFLQLLVYELVHPLEMGNGIVGHLLLADSLKREGKTSFPYLLLSILARNASAYELCYNRFERHRNGGEGNAFAVPLLEILTEGIIGERKRFHEALAMEKATVLPPFMPKSLFPFYMGVVKASLLSFSPIGVSYNDLSFLGLSSRSLRRQGKTLEELGFISFSKQGKKVYLVPCFPTKYSKRPKS